MLSDSKWAIAHNVFSYAMQQENTMRDLTHNEHIQVSGGNMQTVCAALCVMKTVGPLLYSGFRFEGLLTGKAKSPEEKGLALMMELVAIPYLVGSGMETGKAICSYIDKTIKFMGF